MKIIRGRRTSIPACAHAPLVSAAPAASACQVLEPFQSAVVRHLRPRGLLRIAERARTGARVGRGAPGDRAAARRVHLVL